MVKTLKGHTDWVQSVAFDQNGLLASGSDDSTVMLYSGIDSSKPATTIQHYTLIRDTTTTITTTTSERPATTTTTSIITTTRKGNFQYKLTAIEIENQFDHFDHLNGS